MYTRLLLTQVQLRAQVCMPTASVASSKQATAQY